MRQNIGEGMRRLWSRDLQNIVSAIRDGTFEYEEKARKRIVWKLYNEAQVNELADMLAVIKTSVDMAVDRVNMRKSYRKGLPGHPPIPVGDVVKMLLLQGYFGVSDRVAEGFLRVFDLKLGITKPFTYKTIERGYDPDRTGEVLDEIFCLANEWSNSNEDIAGIDGSGDPTTIKVNYESERADQRKKAPKTFQEALTAWPSKKGDFQFSVIGGGMHTKVISGFFTTSDHGVGELSQAPDVMKQTSRNMPNLKIVVGDGLYAKRPFCDLVDTCGAVLYAIPRRDSTLRGHGASDWKRMTYELILDPQGFLDIYHWRSVSESINSMMKRREPIPIRKRLPWRRDTAEYLKVNVHNLRQSCYLTYLQPQLSKLTIGA